MSPYALIVVAALLAGCVPVDPKLPGNGTPTPGATPGATPTPPDDDSGVVVPPTPLPTPGGVGWFAPAPNSKFQVMKEDDGKYSKQLKPGTKIVTIEAVKANYIDLADELADLHEAGVKVICYHSLSFEDWRPDISQFPKEAIGKAMDGWPGEKWADTRPFSKAHAFWDRRYESFAKAGCDCVEDDNMVDPGDNDTGFPLSRAEGRDGMKRRADKAHQLGMCYIAKNNPGMSADYASFSDGVFIEEAQRYDEREDYLPWKNANKFGAMIEYKSTGCKPYTGFSVHYHASGDYFDGMKYKDCSP